MLDLEQKQLLAQLSNTTLVNFVSDVYGIDKILDKKIERLLLQSDKPKLIKKLTTTLKGLRRRRKYIDYWESSEFATELHHLASDVMSLYPKQPQVCLELLEYFIESTNSSMQRCDDSNGEVGQVYSELAHSWVTVASTCYAQQKDAVPTDEQDILSQAWQNRIKAMIADNDYGTKDDILLGINQLLSPFEIRGLIMDYQQQYEAILVKKVDSNNSTEYSENSDYEVKYAINKERYSVERTLKKLAKSLGDVALFETVYRTIYPENPLPPHKLDELLEFLIDNEAYEVAEHYLQDEWQSERLQDRVKRLDWLSKIYNKQEDNISLMTVLGEAFELQSTPARLKSIMSIATPAQQSQWRKKAHELAGQQDNIVTAVSLLLEIKEVTLANQIAITRHSELADVHYTTLTSMLKTLPEDTYLIQVIIYRSLLNDILDSGRSKAYGHAARYYNRLQQIDDTLIANRISYQSLPTHIIYDEALQVKHGKKRSFWEHVND